MDINGESVTFPAGTFYGEIVQAQVDADGYPFKVWNAETNSGDGYDGWYNPENAMAEMELALQDLAEMGYEVSAENPVMIDYPYASYNETAANQGYVLKTSIETALNGLVQINLLDCTDGTEFQNTWFNTQNGSEYNYDMGGIGGVGADFGDPETFLDGLLPYGDGWVTAKMGLW